MVAMRFSCIVQSVARKYLREKGEKVSGIYPGNKGRQTDQPTTPMLLRALRGISVVFVEHGEQSSVVVTSLNSTQGDILKLCGVEQCYERLAELLRTRLKMRET